MHATDVSNASRTMLLDLATLDWSDELLELFSVSHALLPEVRASAEVFGEGTLLGETLPVASLAGDQQASLYAHGDAKATLGTGAFVLVESGADYSPAPRGLVRTAAAGTDRSYALRLRGRSSRPTASTSCLRSPVSARRTGLRTRAGSSAASRAARGASISCAPRSRRPPTRCSTSSMR